MSEMTIKTPDGSFHAYVAAPKTTTQTAPVAAIVVAQEIFGVNKVMRDICDDLARSGYLAVCPDLFWRIEPGIELTDKSEAEWARAFELFQAFNLDKGMKDLAATITTTRTDPRCNGKVGVVGYCLGGRIAFLAATRTKADACVGYYGVALKDHLDEAGSISAPLMLHVPTADKFVPPEDQKLVKDGLASNKLVTLYEYLGQDHAFARPGGEHFHQASADLANTRTKDFFKKHLG